MTYEIELETNQQSYLFDLTEAKFTTTKDGSKRIIFDGLSKSQCPNELTHLFTFSNQTNRCILQNVDEIEHLEVNIPPQEAI